MPRHAIAAGAQAYLQSHGDIRAMVRGLLLYRDPTPAGGDFAHSWGQKVKTPLEFYASAMRALNAPSVKHLVPNDWGNGLGAPAFRIQIEMLGQKLFDFSAPTGYPDIRFAWWNTNQVFARWTLANMLVNALFGSQTTYPAASNPNPAPPLADAALDQYIGNTGGAPPTAATVVDRLITRIAGRAVDPGDRANLIAYLGDGDSSASVTSAHFRIRPLIATLLASPYFMWK